MSGRKSIDESSNVVSIGKTAGHWRTKIQAAWQKGVDSIIETGLLLKDAKAELPHGDFIAMVESDLPFGRHAAHQLMTIASDKRLSNVEHVQHLPASWGTLYQITKLPDKVFDAKLKDGTINPKMERRDVAALLQPKRATASKSKPPSAKSGISRTHHPDTDQFPSAPPIVADHPRVVEKLVKEVEAKDAHIAELEAARDTALTFAEVWPVMVATVAACSGTTSANALRASLPQSPEFSAEQLNWIGEGLIYIAKLWREEDRATKHEAKAATTAAPVQVDIKARTEASLGAVAAMDSSAQDKAIDDWKRNGRAPS